VTETKQPTDRPTLLESHIAALEKEHAEGSSDDVRNWAADGLPVLREHLQLARNADDYLGSVSQILRKK
jgi:hypothetical protein